MIRKDSAQKSIAILWFVGFAVLFLCILILTITGKYNEKEVLVWGWFLPLTLPILSLITTVFVIQVTRQDELQPKRVARFIFRLAFSFSVFYLLIVFATLIASSIVGGFEEEFLSKSGLWLGPIQGIVGALMGIFFTKQED